MSAPILRLTGLPTEILEKILLYLPSQEVIKMEVINRQFQDLTCNSPELQYKRNLLSAGLVENPHSPCDFSRCRNLCEELERKWSSAGRVAKAVHKLPEELSADQLSAMVGGRNLITFHDMMENGGLGVVRLPPVTGRGTIEWWTIPRFPFNSRAPTVHPPDGIIAVVEEKERFVFVHFIDLLDGSPRSAPPSNVMWELPRGVDGICVEGLIITGSRIMIHFLCWEEVGQGEVELCKVLVWDWETGDLILNLSSTDRSTPVTGNSRITFLDEYRMVVLTVKPIPGVPEITLFDTLVPRGNPVSSGRFLVPPRCYDWFPTVFVDDDQCTGTRDRDRPLTTDPAQAVFVLRLGGPQGLCIWLIVRIQTLVERVCSMGADTCVPWDEWGRGAVVMDVSHVSRRDTPHSGPYPLVHGTHVIMVERSTAPGIDGCYHHLRTFDFGRRGWSALPLCDADDGVERRVAFESGRNFLLQGNEEMNEWAFYSLGDGRLMYLDDSSGSRMLHIWELI